MWCNPYSKNEFRGKLLFMSSSRNDHEKVRPLRNFTLRTTCAQPTKMLCASSSCKYLAEITEHAY